MGVNCEVCDCKAMLWEIINGYQHYRCENCKHLFVFPRPNQVELDQFYSSIYSNNEFYINIEDERERLTHESLQRLSLLDDMRRKASLSKYLLDVGCGSGYFLSMANKLGWDCVGIDRAPESAKMAQENSGVKIIHGCFDEVDFSGNKFDVITAWEVVEHVPAAEVFFQAAANHLKRNGLFAISTPRSDGMVAKFMGVNFPMINPPHHLSLFSYKSINLLAKKYDFESVKFLSFSGLGLRSLASGFCRMVLKKRLGEIPALAKGAFYVLALFSVWIPFVVDKLGHGTEMLIIFQKRNSVDACQG